jgi:hypothetical protein
MWRRVMAQLDQAKANTIDAPDTSDTHTTLDTINTFDVLRRKSEHRSRCSWATGLELVPEICAGRVSACVSRGSGCSTTGMATPSYDASQPWAPPFASAHRRTMPGIDTDVDAAKS